MYFIGEKYVNSIQKVIGSHEMKNNKNKRKENIERS